MRPDSRHGPLTEVSGKSRTIEKVAEVVLVKIARSFLRGAKTSGLLFLQASDKVASDKSLRTQDRRFHFGC